MLVGSIGYSHLESDRRLLLYPNRRLAAEFGLTSVF